MNKILIALLIVSSISKAQNWNVKKDTSYYKNHRIQSIVEVTGVVDHDTIIETDEFGKSKMRIEDIRYEHGLCQYFYESGVLMAEGKMLYSAPVGNWKFFDSTGLVYRTFNFSKIDTSSTKILSDTFFVVPEGWHFATYEFYLRKIPTKDIRNAWMACEEVDFHCLQFLNYVINGEVYEAVPHGLVTYYYPDDKTIHSQGYYFNREQVGIWKYYDEKGQLKFEKDFKKEKLLKLKGKVPKDKYNDYLPKRAPKF